MGRRENGVSTDTVYVNLPRGGRGPWLVPPGPANLIYGILYTVIGGTMNCYRIVVTDNNYNLLKEYEVPVGAKIYIRIHDDVEVILLDKEVKTSE